MIKFEDSPLDFFKNTNGYYRVGEKFFYKKFNAVVESINTNERISWDFHRNVFEPVIKNPNINLNLLELYKQRAQQLRDSYDYLILAFSGGSDSDNMLKTFLYNNIKLDEIWSDFPKSLIEKSNYVLSNSRDPSNMAAEMYTVVIPELMKVSQQHPSIKIHFSDNWENGSYEDNEDTLSITNAPATYLMIQRYRYILDYASKIVESGKKVAIIYGFDKPIPVIKDNQYGMAFGDRATYMKSDYYNDVFVPIEYFYWSPTFPELPVAQARLLWNYLLNDKQDTVRRMKNTSPDSSFVTSRDSAFDSIIKNVCYPYWDFSKLQTDKSGLLFNRNYMHFVEKHKNEMKYQSYISSLQVLKKLPNTIFASGSRDGDLVANYCFFPMGEFSL